MGIACRGSVKAGCAAFVNPRTGFLMPVRFSVYGPRGLSCPLPSALAAALQGNARGCARCGLRGGGGRAQRAQRRGPWPPPLVWLAGGAKGPPAAKRRRPPRTPAVFSSPMPGVHPWEGTISPAHPAPFGLSCPLPSALAAALQGNARGCGTRCGLRGGRRARAARTKAGALAPAFGLAGRGAKGPPAAKRRRPPRQPTGAHGRSGLSSSLVPMRRIPALRKPAPPLCKKEKAA